MCRRFRIIIQVTYWDIRTRDIRNICLQTYRNNRICKKVTYFLRKIQTSWLNYSRILWIKNAKFSGYWSYMSLNIHGNIHSCTLKNWRCLQTKKIKVILYLFTNIGPEAVVLECSVKKVFLEISQNSQEKQARVSFLIKLQASALELY